ncbi:hypothetical protein Pcinc_033179 [Petrolisthes cinctipes]|uniref:Post-GPI attachment to proteins factor 3 n=1 Tax=Petrolisthes cinctipes TaxID=88211 RepID=A0AAE1EST1_PETCI|nr:hypothetical protein Pcinc_033179 [Petrolisthes cinctipes]
MNTQVVIIPVTLIIVLQRLGYQVMSGGVQCHSECYNGRVTMSVNITWPFTRLCGLQEPASVFFSLLNLLAHVVNVRRFRLSVPPSAPLYWLWCTHAVVCINAWIWSVVFHARDTPTTEKLDYFCAFSMVLFSLIALIVRMLGRRYGYLRQLVCMGGITFFIFHVWYLTKARFDYGYNMKVNVCVGIINGCGWVAWCIPRIHTRSYVRWCGYTVLAAMVTMLLEVMDFPPLLWTLDAHALWHLSTAPLPFMWYRFLESDCLYLLQQSSRPDYKKHI